MNKSLIICDRLMYGAFLGMIFFIPYSLALIEICQVTMMVAWACKSFCSPRFKFISSSLGWSLIAIALLIVLTIPFSHYPSLSIKKFFTRFLQQIFLMYLVTQIIHSSKRLYGVLSVLLLTLVFVVIDGMVQYITGRSIVHHTPLIFGRVSGPMNHPNDLGTLLVTVIPVVLMSIIVCRKWMPGQPWVVGVVISALFLFLVNALGLTASRGAWVAFAVSMGYLGILLRNRKLTIFIFLMLAVFLGGYGTRCLSTRLDMYDVAPTQGAVLSPYNAFGLFFGPSGREYYWGTAVNVIKHFPWYGCGYSAYVQTLRDLHVGHEEYPHNSLLHIAAELGLVGLALYMWFFTALWLKIKNVLREVSSERDLYLIGCGLSAGILAWAIHSLMDTAWASLQLGVLWWLFIGILLSLGGLSKEKKSCL